MFETTSSNTLRGIIANPQTGASARSDAAEELRVRASMQAGTYDDTAIVVGLPTDLAGTILNYGAPGQIVLADDDAAAWHAAGYTVLPMNCACSARIVDGDDDGPADTFWAAIDTHGAPLEDLAALVGAENDGQDAIGVFHGATLGAAVFMVRGGARAVRRAHANLAAGLPGFECFAVLTLDTDRPVMLAD